MDSFQQPDPLDSYSNYKDLLDDSLLLNYLIGKEEEEGALLQSETGPKLGYIRDRKINDMMKKINSITDTKANEFIKVIGEITTNNNELKSELDKIRKEVDSIKSSIEADSIKSSIKSSIRKRNRDNSNLNDKERLKNVKTNYDYAKKQYRTKRVNIDNLIAIKKKNALELQDRENVQDMPMTREQFQEAKQELKNLKESDIEPSIFEGFFDNLNYDPALGQISQEQFEEAKQELENLQKFDINPLILDGLDRSIEELEKTVLEPMSGDWNEQLGKSNYDGSNSKIQKTSKTGDNIKGSTMGGRRTKKRRNMRRNSKRKKPMRKKSMRKKSMRKKSMRKKSMRRRRSSKKKY